MGAGDYRGLPAPNPLLPYFLPMQFHVWEDAWAEDERWQRAMDDLKRQGLIKAVGISINRWEPNNAIRTLRTGLIDAVQVIYNYFWLTTYRAICGSISVMSKLTHCSLLAAPAENTVKPRT